MKQSRVEVSGFGVQVSCVVRVVGAWVYGSFRKLGGGVLYNQDPTI